MNTLLSKALSFGRLLVVVASIGIGTHAFAVGATSNGNQDLSSSVSYAGSLSQANQYDGGAMSQYFNAGMAVVMIISFMIAVALVIFSVIGFLQSGEWSKIQTKMIGFVLFMGISVVIGYFTGAVTAITGTQL